MPEYTVTTTPPSYKRRITIRRTAPMSQSDQAEMEYRIMLSAFENELDALLAMMESDARGKQVAESIIRRYASAEAIYKEMQEDMTRLHYKMLFVQEKVTDFGGRPVLEDSGAADSESA